MVAYIGYSACLLIRGTRNSLGIESWPGRVVIVLTVVCSENIPTGAARRWYSGLRDGKEGPIA